MKYKINTDVFGGGRIIQELSSVDDNNQITRLSRWIIDTKEEAVHQALLKLGWTPPNDVNRPDACECPQGSLCEFFGKDKEDCKYGKI